MIYRESTCKTALSKSSLPGIDYSLNPYTGCEHACIYCYAPSTLRYYGIEPWGTFVTAKTNIPVVLARELRKARPGVVGVSTVTDPYQPLEKKLRLTRSCLEVLQAKAFPVCIQTKSALVLRDLDILRDFKEINIGLTVTALSDEIATMLEPGASLPGERLRALKELSDAGIDTWAFIGPMIPGLLDRESVYSLLDEVKKAGASKVIIDKLRQKPGLRETISPVIDNYLKRTGINEVLSNEIASSGLMGDALKACKELGLTCELAF